MKIKIIYGISFYVITSILSISYANDIPFPAWYTAERAKIELMDYFVLSTNKAESTEFYKIKEIHINPIKYDWGLHCFEGIIVFDTPTCKGKKFDIMWSAGNCENGQCYPIWILFDKFPSPAANI